MFSTQTIIFICAFQIAFCSWVSEWMSPIRDQFKESPSRRSEFSYRDENFEYENIKPISIDTTESTPSVLLNTYSTGNVPISALKMKLESTLKSARTLADSLKLQIDEISSQEALLKDAIANGRSGISTVTVTSMGKAPRTYIIRDGFWSVCGGLLQTPTPHRTPNFFNEPLSVPRCIGKEVIADPDPCIFNSIIKYETVPIIRRVEYVEDDFLCLKKSFNTTLERYLSVPRQIINNTCENGVVRSLEENIEKCGMRVMSEYTYYPSQSLDSMPSLPLEYCTELDGSCKLLIAWHVSNSTIENFEFLKNERGFKNFFIKPGSYIEHII